MINEDIYKYMTPGSKQSVWQILRLPFPYALGQEEF